MTTATKARGGATAGAKPTVVSPSPGTTKVRGAANGAAKPKAGSPSPVKGSGGATPAAKPIAIPPSPGKKGRADYGAKPSAGSPSPHKTARVQGKSDTHCSPDPRPWLELRILAEMFEDAQQARMACVNRVERAAVNPTVYETQLAAMKRAEHVIGLELHRCYRRVVPAPIRAWQKESHGIGEHLLARLLGIIGHPVHTTLHAWDGTGSDRVLGVVGTMDRRVSDLWSYCGHGDPARKRRTGMSAEDAAALGSPRAKPLVRLLAKAVMKEPGRTWSPEFGGHHKSPDCPCSKCTATDKDAPPATLLPIPNALAPEGLQVDRPPKRDSTPREHAADGLHSANGATGDSKPTPWPPRWPYRIIYDEARDRYADRVNEEGVPWTDGHQDGAALRYVGKMILRDLWLAASDVEV